MVSKKEVNGFEHNVSKRRAEENSQDQTGNVFVQQRPVKSLLPYKKMMMMKKTKMQEMGEK